MGDMTPKHDVWYPDLTDIDQPNVWAATMAQSIADGIGDRLEKQESFVGVNLSLDSGMLCTSGTPTVVPFKVKQSYNYSEGMTVNTSGSVTVLTAGMYQVNINANFLPAETTAARINTYLFKGGNGISFSSTYGETNSFRYSNCNIVGVFKFAVGDVIDARVAVFDANTNLSAGNGSNFSMALVSRS